MRDWVDDTDLMLPRICTEFPKYSEAYKTKSINGIKPWGKISEPICLDPFMDENVMRLNPLQYK